MYPDKSPHFLEAYKEATEQPYGYLVVDLKPDTPDDQRLQANILRDHETMLPPVKTNFNYQVQVQVQVQNILLT